MAPEMFTGELFTFSADMYAIGQIVYNMFFGEVSEILLFLFRFVDTRLPQEMYDPREWEGGYLQAITEAGVCIDIKKCHNYSIPYDAVRMIRHVSRTTHASRSFADIFDSYVTCSQATALLSRG